MANGCCGQPTLRMRRRAAAKETEELPDNPEVPGGIPLLYLGSGRKDLHGSGSGLTYAVSERRRHFVAHPEDAPALIKNRCVILAP